MDTLAHGLWAAFLFWALALLLRRRFSLRGAFAAGILPDIIAFGPAFLWITWQSFFGDVGFSDIPAAEEGIKIGEAFPAVAFTDTLYSAAHSFVVFAAVFLAAYLLVRRPMWELAAWALHIGMDIFTHTSTFYATPFAWPLSDVSISGIPWATPLFISVNYALLMLAAAGLYAWQKRRADGEGSPPEP